MSNNINKVKQLTSSDYKYGFISDIKEDRIPTKKQAQDILEIKQYDWNKRNINWKK
mgnify:CR=1 FL=1